MPWLKFAVCAILIGVAGPILTHYADTIARLTGLSRSWVGLVLLAGATSLPELFTGVSAVAVASAPNIALGDALGSCIFNLAMLVVLDVMSRNEPVYRYIDQGHILTAGFGVHPDRICRRPEASAGRWLGASLSILRAESMRRPSRIAALAASFKYRLAGFGRQPPRCVSNLPFGAKSAYVTFPPRMAFQSYWLRECPRQNWVPRRRAAHLPLHLA
jgi:hypothetical protein